jgi:hypothetical protein
MPEYPSAVPISLRRDDIVFINSRTGRLEQVERAGIVIWRAGWVN